MRRLLERFGPPRKATHPEFPFWHLQTDGLWEIPDADKLHKKKGGRSVPASTLRKLGVLGGLPNSVDQLLRRDPELIEMAVVTLLNGHFPDSLHTSVRDAVGLSGTNGTRDVRNLRGGATAQTRPQLPARCPDRL